MQKTLIWADDCLRLLDQTKLPDQTEYITCTEYRRVAEAIRRLEVRGAPAIGAAAAFGLVLGAREAAAEAGEFWNMLWAMAAELRGTRPTAVNLFWAIDRMLAVASRYKDPLDKIAMLSALETEAVAISREDAEVNQRISINGTALFTDKLSILTHCNAGALATVALGTALGVIRQAWSEGKISRVFADETRPLLQGARLTAWELLQEGIPTTLITDNMAGWVMKKRMVDAVIVGADRITLNGDVANKIGTYSVAVLAKEHNIPFYVAAPVSTFDFSLRSGDDIIIEERSSREVTSFAGINTAPRGVEVFNPAFDVTPNSLVTAIITEYGVIKPSYIEAINKLKELKGGE
ncbi:MAG: Methylthioribose-phosphate isomerase [Firmicutes bacterium]|nr:Methylthioribose-phosphate isomerase [Bacillota bacterium]